jgi:hypothetical protein
VSALLPILSFVLACAFLTGLGVVLLTLIPGLRRTAAGVFVFVVGAFAGSFGIGRVTVGFFSRASGEPAGIPGFVVQFIIVAASAIGVGLLATWALQRDWSKKP